MTIQPCNNRIVLKSVKTQGRPSGLIVPSSESPQYEVIHVGPGKYDAHEQGKLPMPVSEGDIVLVDPYGLKEIRLNGIDYVSCKSDDVIGIIQKKV